MAYNELIDAIRDNRPLALYLGQEVLKLETGRDALLADAFKKCMSQDETRPVETYSNLLNATKKVEPEFFDWFAARAEKISPPRWLEILSGINWSAVFTSAIDPLLTRVFRSGWRQVEPVLSANHIPSDPRRRSLLHVTYLFGRTTNSEEDQRVPRSILELRVRQTAQAVPLLNRIPETVGALGLLCIDALALREDWLRLDDLVGVLSQLSPGQVHWFGWNDPEPEFLDSSGLKDLIDSGVVKTYSEHLGEILDRLDADGAIKLHSPPAGLVSDRTVSIRDKPIQIPLEIWLNSTTSSIRIVDDQLIERRQPTSESKLYDEFRKFLGTSDDSDVLIGGVARGFSIHRDFDPQLSRLVTSALADPSKHRHPIILHGQSGSGKSVALATLAYRVRSEGQYAVLHSCQSGRLLGAGEFDDFCKFVEDNGGRATLIILDANVDLGQYASLKRTLSSRGRNVVVVGSCYTVNEQFVDHPVSPKHVSNLFVPASPILSAKEYQLVQTVLHQFAPEISKQLQTARISNMEHMLVILYRLLPENRYKISLGLGREAAMYEDSIRKAADQTEIKNHAGTLAEALVAAGLKPSAAVFEDSVVEIAGDAIDRAGQIIFYVMVPGRLGIGLPLTLLVRVIGHKQVERLTALFRAVDLFRWHEGGDGEIYVYPRLMLEARLICNRRLGGPDAEAEFAKKLLTQIRSTGEFVGPEVRFAQELCHALGPNGSEGQRYARWYREFSDTLFELRKTGGIHNSSLMLQEATLRREYLKAASEGAIDDATRTQLLQESVATLLEAIRIAPEGRNSQRHRSNLKVELASTYGFLSQQSKNLGHSIDEVRKYYVQARKWARQASFSDPESYYPIDVSLWSAMTLYRDARLDSEQRIELQADIWDILDSVEEQSLDSAQNVRYLQRQQEAGDLFEDELLAESAFQKLLSSGSSAGILLRARSYVGAFPRDGKVTLEFKTRLARACEFMAQYSDQVERDSRALNYWLKVYWPLLTGNLLFVGERQPLPPLKSNIQELLGIANGILRNDGSDSNPRVQYLVAVFNWRLGNYQAAKDIWRNLAQATDYTYTRRVVKHHVFSDSLGEPRLFNGQVQAVDAVQQRVTVLVEELRQPIDLFPRDFDVLDLRRGAAVPTFHIAFNFIGPIADSLKFYRK